MSEEINDAVLLEVCVKKRFTCMVDMVCDISYEIDRSIDAVNPHTYRGQVNSRDLRFSRRLHFSHCICCTLAVIPFAPGGIESFRMMYFHDIYLWILSIKAQPIMHACIMPESNSSNCSARESKPAQTPFLHLERQS